MKLKYVFTRPEVKSSQCKTKSDLNACKHHFWSTREAREIENIPVNEFNLPLTKLFGQIRKQNESDYEPATLSDFQGIEIETRSMILPYRASAQLIRTAFYDWPVNYCVTDSRCHSLSNYHDVIYYVKDWVCKM